MSKFSGKDLHYEGADIYAGTILLELNKTGMFVYLLNEDGT